jgi:Polyketide cyclase / dehydrase and lipid transport
MAGVSLGTAALAVAGLVVVLLVVLAVVGSLLPPEHVATRRLAVSRPPDAVWAVIVDLGGQLTWRSSLKGASKVSDPDACDGDVGEVWREVVGRHPLDLKTLEAAPPCSGRPGRLVREIINEELPFRGRWEYEVAPAPDGPGSVITLTERGEVSNLVFRALNRFLIGQSRTIDAYLRDLACRLGEPPRLR